MKLARSNLADPFSPTLRLELWLFALFQLAWAGVCLVILFATPDLLPIHAGRSGMGSLFEVLGDWNLAVLGTIGAILIAGGASLFAWRWCGLWAGIASQLLLALMILYASLMYLSEAVAGDLLSNQAMAILGVLAMSCGILWRLLVFQRTLQRTRGSHSLAGSATA